MSSFQIFVKAGPQKSDTYLRRRNVFKSSIFLLSRLITSFKMFSCSVVEKWKLSLFVIFYSVRLILGCCSYFLIAISTGFFKPWFSFEYSFVLIPSEWIAFSKKLLHELATLDTSEITFYQWYFRKNFRKSVRQKWVQSFPEFLVVGEIIQI